MTNSSFAPFSMMGGVQKERIDRAINQALDILEEIHNAPHAVKENLMKTEFKIANTSLNFVGRILQAESAMVQAVTSLADKADKSEEFREMISGNLPQINIKVKKLKGGELE